MLQNVTLSAEDEPFYRYKLYVSHHYRGYHYNLAVSMDIVMIFLPLFKIIKNPHPLLYTVNDYLHSVNVWTRFVLLCPPRPHRVKQELSRDTGKTLSRSHDSGLLKYTCHTRTLPVTLQRWGGERRCFVRALQLCALLHCARLSALRQRCERVMQQADKKKKWRRGTVWS